MSNTYKGKEYKLEAGQYDCFEGWKNDNVDYIVEEFGNDILCIDNKNRDYLNIFEGAIDTSHIHDIYDDTECIEIEVRGYSQNEYDTYYIFLHNGEKKKEIEKQLDFIKEVFTIISTEVRLYERKTIEENETEYFTEWEEIDSEESQVEFVDVGELSQTLLKRNNINRYDIENIPTEAHYIG